MPGRPRDEDFAARFDPHPDARPPFCVACRPHLKRRAVFIDRFRNEDLCAVHAVERWRRVKDGDETA